MNSPTINMLATLLAKLDCMTNSHHVLSKSVAGYNVTKDYSTNVLVPCDTLTQLYTNIEAYYYNVMYARIV
jgi:hypothetical protein